MWEVIFWFLFVILLYHSGMTILVRTPEGDTAIQSQDARLPRRMRSLLIAIDGKTDSRVYTSSLSPTLFGNVAELLESLKLAGLICSAAEQRAAPEPSQIPAPAPAIRAAEAQTSVAQTRQAVGLMSDFVQENLASNALEWMFTIDQLSNRAQIAAMLPLYAAQIAPLGKPAREHINQIKALIASA